MKKNGWILFLFIVLGMIAGALVARWLDSVPGVSFLTRPIQTTWSPNVDLYVLSFNLSLSLQISLLSIAGAAVAIWLYRKM
ncbi:hypothetical protein B1748_03750 [Paenibacillus sp. MY03]|jgi:uncharacterized membrane protein YeaQ/YmgE (transglycosylase-associated protein family)|uniref:DUF4321 domain-containing protein n=1 Tax=Paenibacillus agaridevorans TaxID=171404 RepID=A0A2R5EPX3_9BACL|nr:MULTISPECIES: DUF4321 domain-containing protein [Paenibacillus]OUS77896.1 hypothetical protein B1748_03750 [Paenibacillus sp. MY03]QNK60026.1 DUF4321 domain-containing protein [Paenibacillus sp. PAMC21692]GBG08756.1 hypothetical protein PAT3040_03352 [Paenibacillus agaridevorans]